MTRWIDIPHDERNRLADKLSEKQLLVYILRSGGYSWTRISSDLNLQIRTVRTHHHAAQITHAQIRAELERDAA